MFSRKFTPRHARNSSAGFTLVEVMMGVTILVVGFIDLIQAVTIGSESLDTSRRQQIATQIMDGEIERLSSGPWTIITGLPATGTIRIHSARTILGEEVLRSLR